MPRNGIDAIMNFQLAVPTLTVRSVALSNLPLSLSSVKAKTRLTAGGAN